MDLKSINLIPFLILCTIFLKGHLEAQVKVSKSVFSNGASHSSVISKHSKSIVGQTLVGQTTNAVTTVNAGYLYNKGKLIKDYENQINQVPEKFELKQNYPNPFNPVTTIEFAIPKQTLVNLTIFDIHGRKVLTLVNETLISGSYKIRFDAKDYGSGVYFYRIQTDEFVDIKKLILIK